MGEPSFVDIDSFRDAEAKRLGLLIGIPGVMYCRSVGRVSYVFVENIEGDWVAWKENFAPNIREEKKVKVIAQGNNFEVVLKQLDKKYLKYFRK